MRISDWSSDVCSSDLGAYRTRGRHDPRGYSARIARSILAMLVAPVSVIATRISASIRLRSEEHTSELQSLMRISYAVFCLKKKKKTTNTEQDTKNENVSK